MAGAHLTDVCRKRAGARCQRLVPVVAQERIEPDEPAAGCAEATGGVVEARAAFPIEPVCKQKNSGVLAEDAAGPQPIEGGQAFADPGAAAPVLW